MQIDYLIVGSGLTGATIARMLHDSGREVMVLERRSHVGGNVHDHKHESGIRIHTYGPHYFRTNSDRIWEYVNQFSEFYPYEACLKSLVDGQYENWPIAGSYIRRHVGKDWKPSFDGMPKNFEEASLAMMPELIYRKFVKGYTEKQWGVPTHELSANLAKRFDVREDDEPRLKCHKYQGIPLNGYHIFMQKMLAGIPLQLNYDYLKHREEIKARKNLIYCGPIDEFFDFKLGRLKYRSQKRINEYFPELNEYQPYGQINNPDPSRGQHIRTLEWKHMMPKKERKQVKGTVITREITITPENPDQYEYPFPDGANQKLFNSYREIAEGISNLIICGRLGEYRYYDMDQAIARAMMLSEKIITDYI